MISRIKTAIKKILKHKVSDDEFYTDLFIHNAAWNSAAPNEEERLRWATIESFILQIKDLRALSNDNSIMEILDLGCGRGWLSNLLSNYGNVTGIEPVQSVVEYANKLFQQLTIKKGTIEDIIAEGKTEYYDLVVCSEVVEHIPDNNKVHFINKINAAIKRKGFLIITTPRKDAEPEWKKYSDPNQPVEDWLTEKSLEELLVAASFKTLSLKRFSIPPVKNAPPIEIYQLWLAQKV
ncbi:class I SAM-dependent methyltransferase [Mucilaginibacter pocheonensis]|uniref:2-polyprenyl-3-methyl-5-hydroxy-6-metoxy-1, 4-benzoquinol methylase n=1 Tax=Mucilaginibacter pocheonensis TaxID=398050 RepID=A0ABU1T501_9SPHI|nr:class I SAM-dependent methyltransferase [Mucilaginibacter pocheonensis]MDR6940418.1 2-polyprenyl-3-methyl-5-hydroxy-6-metoxy-1,4-benzoquinol methylase [Mucilaginibacter pocheonensis]